MGDLTPDKKDCYLGDTCCDSSDAHNQLQPLSGVTDPQPMPST